MSQMTVSRAASSEALSFGDAEHLLVWAWRRIAAGRGGCPVVARAFVEACGEDGAEVAATLVAFLRVLAKVSRRPLATAPPGDFSPTLDERQVLTLIGAAQGGDAGAFDARLAALADPGGEGVLAIGARALAKAFAVHGLDLFPPSAATLAGPGPAAGSPPG